ncbi:transient receptor potential cation channel subfamily M member 7-like [Amphiura filiformis]|uniref:transient receptor potential cation channel subfamily M member 7-like n=1 Tax=Amphiura filiformis TaxID=82378 RepID=UPI003B218A94
MAENTELSTLDTLKRKTKDPEKIRLTEAKIYESIEEDEKKSTYTRAYGKINFTTGNEETSGEYVRLDHKSKSGDILQLLKEDWKLSTPGLLISVTGAAGEIKEIKPKDRATYFGAIVDAAVSTNAWIITGGTDAGVMKYTGDAVKKHRDTTGDEVTTIGIATWGVIKKAIETCWKSKMKRLRMPKTSEKENAKTISTLFRTFLDKKKEIHLEVICHQRNYHLKTNQNVKTHKHRLNLTLTTLTSS